MDLLYSMGHWHGLAKLRMHNDLTLQVLESVTRTLGIQLRDFSQKNCPAFDTVELRREHQARLRRESKKAGPHSQVQHREQAFPNSDVNAAAGAAHTSTAAGSSTPILPASVNRPSQSTSVRAGRRRKTLNINTYKFHSYGDYARTIRIHGTTDSYSTEPVRCYTIHPTYTLIYAFIIRASWSIVHLNRGIHEQVAKASSSKLQGLNAVKRVSDEFVNASSKIQIFILMKTSLYHLNLIMSLEKHRIYLWIWVLLSTIT